MTRAGRGRSFAAMLNSSPQSQSASRAAGRVCAAGAAVLVAGAVATQVAQSSTTVSDEAWSYPWSSGTSIALSAVWCVAQIALLAGIAGLRRGGVAGAGRAARIGLALAAAGTAVIALGHLASIAVADGTMDDTGPQIAGGVFGLGTLLSAAGLLLAGRETFRAGVWTGWRRPLVAATGLAGVALMGLQFTPALPTAVGVFDLGFLGIGLALAVAPAPAVEARPAEAVQGA